MLLGFGLKTEKYQERSKQIRFDLNLYISHLFRAFSLLSVHSGVCDRFLWEVYILIIFPFCFPLWCDNDHENLFLLKLSSIRKKKDILFSYIDCLNIEMCSFTAANSLLINERRKWSILIYTNWFRLQLIQFSFVENFLLRDFDLIYMNRKPIINVEYMEKFTVHFWIEHLRVYNYHVSCVDILSRESSVRRCSLRRRLDSFRFITWKHQKHYQVNK